jgi:hypothetical protein
MESTADVRGGHPTVFCHSFLPQFFTTMFCYSVLPQYFGYGFQTRQIGCFVRVNPSEALSGLMLYSRVTPS